jgi:hypothetical protein
LKKLTRGKDGQELSPVDQSARSPCGRPSPKGVLVKEGLDKISAVENYWRQQIYSGRGTPPSVKTSDDEVRKFVAATPGAIGYVGEKADLTGVKPSRSRIEGRNAHVCPHAAPARHRRRRRHPRRSRGDRRPDHPRLHQPGLHQDTKNELYFGHTTDGNFEINEAALSFSTEPSRAAHRRQLFAQDLGSLGNHRVIVDWAVGDYRSDDWLRRRGRQAQAAARPLRHAARRRPRPSGDLQPEAIYSDNLKDLVRAFNGASVYGTSSWAAPATWTTRRSAAPSAPTNRGRQAHREHPGGRLRRGLAASGLRQVRATAEPIDGTMRHMYGGALEYRPPVEACACASPAGRTTPSSSPARP